MEPVCFKLYIAGQSPNSVRALANLKALCTAKAESLPTVKVIDVLRDPAAAIQDKVFATPTLIRTSPSPVRMVIGTLDRPSELELLFPVKPLDNETNESEARIS